MRQRLERIQQIGAYITCAGVGGYISAALTTEHATRVVPCESSWGTMCTSEEIVQATEFARTTPQMVIAIGVVMLVLPEILAYHER